MHLIRLIPVLFFSLSAISLFSFQAGEIVSSLQEFFNFYNHKS
ncbi:hypothetical protein SAMN04487975_10335 [Planococcus glaciei]|nr:hypothetical protein SAMN04487975_10335 [Planococcus glaciei]